MKPSITTCAVSNCPAPARAGGPFCRFHWNRCPTALRNRLILVRLAGGDSADTLTPDYADALDAARDAVRAREAG